MEVIADTTVLIDLWRYRKIPRRLADLTGKVGEAAILVPWITFRMSACQFFWSLDFRFPNF